MKHLNLVILAVISILLSVSNGNSQGILTSIETKLNQYKAKAAKERVLVLTDRDIYEPGGLVWLDITTFDIFSPSISRLSEEVTISVINQENFEILNKKLPLEEGSAGGLLVLPPNLTNGLYLIKAKSSQSGGESHYDKKIVVRDNVLPRYLIEASFPDKEYIPGDQFAMALQFKDFYNEPEKKTEYQIELYDDIRKVSEILGKANKAGQAIEQINIPVGLKSGIFSYRVVASGKSGNAMLSGKIPVLSEQLFIDFFPENGRLLNGIETEINFYAYDVSGNPLTIEADLLEDELPIQTFTSDQEGLGSFMISPDMTKKYKVRMKRPLLLEKFYDLPPVEAKGISLRPTLVEKDLVSYKLVNAYQSERLIFLVGVSGSEIFWKSEHKLDRELNVDIDLSKASSRMAHFVIFNAAEHIEGEHILLVPEPESKSLSMSKSSFSAEKRGENHFTIDFSQNLKGKMVFTAVNSPWNLDNIGNQNISSIELPSDLYKQLIFRSRNFNSSELNAERLEKYMQYYRPIDFGMNKVVKQKGAYDHSIEKYAELKEFSFINPLIGQYREERSGGNIQQINMHANDLFATSNPQYYLNAYKKKEQKRPAYKDMLENGVPVMDALQAVKPYSINGNNIVFISSAISISSQGGSLIVIDGVASGTDPFVIRNLNPRNVESIFVSTEASDIQRYTAFNTTGLIEIKTKTGISDQEVEVEIDEDQEFEAPDYSTGTGGPKDYRKTLNWVRGFVEDGQSTNDFIFYNSDLISTIMGRVYYIPQAGNPRQITFENEVK